MKNNFIFLKIVVEVKNKEEEYKSVMYGTK